MDMHKLQEEADAVGSRDTVEANSERAETCRSAAVVARFGAHPRRGGVDSQLVLQLTVARARAS